MTRKKTRRKHWNLVNPILQAFADQLQWPVNGRMVSMSPEEHARGHGQGRVFSETTKQKMRVGASRRVSDPEHRRLLSERAKAQHAAGRLGRATWTETSDPGQEVWRQAGRLQTDRLRKMATQTSSEEMSRRSYQRKMFQETEK